MKKVICLIVVTILFSNCSGDDENNDPSAFEILEFDYFRGCGEFLDQKEYVGFKFNESTDSDGDEISYEMNFGGLVWDLPSEGINTFRGFSGFTDGVGYFRNITELDLPAEFPDFLNEKEVEFKITAKDGRGGEAVASKMINVTNTDVDLGTLPIPYTNTVSYDQKNELIDQSIAYTFTVDKEVNYTINFELTDGSSPNSYPRISISKINGEIVQLNTFEDKLLMKGTLLAGTYILQAKSILMAGGINGICRRTYSLRAGTITITIDQL